MEWVQVNITGRLQGPPPLHCCPGLRGSKGHPLGAEGGGLRGWTVVTQLLRHLRGERKHTADLGLCNFSSENFSYGNYQKPR